MIVVINGVPGSGKTFWACRLIIENVAEVLIGGDCIKPLLTKELSKLPSLSIVGKKNWKKLFLEHSRPYLELGSKIASFWHKYGKNVVLEGTQFHAGILKLLDAKFFLLAPPIERIARNLEEKNKNREIPKEWDLEKIIKLQKFLLELARKYNARVVENGSEILRLLAQR